MRLQTNAQTVRDWLLSPVPWSTRERFSGGRRPMAVIGGFLLLAIVHRVGLFTSVLPCVVAAGVGAR
jgi:hypothetical protein